MSNSSTRWTGYSGQSRVMWTKTGVPKICSLCKLVPDLLSVFRFTGIFAYVWNNVGSSRMHLGLLMSVAIELKLCEGLCKWKAEWQVILDWWQGTRVVSVSFPHFTENRMLRRKQHEKWHARPILQYIQSFISLQSSTLALWAWYTSYFILLVKCGTLVCPRCGYRSFGVWMSMEC